jgi:hypothetical protein
MASMYIRSSILLTYICIEVMAQYLVLSLSFTKCILDTFIVVVLENQYQVIRKG